MCMFRCPPTLRPHHLIYFWVFVLLKLFYVFTPGCAVSESIRQRRSWHWMPTTSRQRTSCIIVSIIVLWIRPRLRRVAPGQPSRSTTKTSPTVGWATKVNKWAPTRTTPGRSTTSRKWCDRETERSGKTLWHELRKLWCKKFFIFCLWFLVLFLLLFLSHFYHVFLFPFSTRIPACKTAPFQLFVSLDFPFFARPKNYLRPSTLVGWVSWQWSGGNFSTSWEIFLWNAVFLI